MRNIRLLFGSFAMLAVTLGGGLASADVSKSESFDVSNRTSLKVLEPPGAHVFVTIGQDVKEDTAPAIFSLPDADAYVNVKVVMQDGESWTGKAEIKAYRQTVLRFTQTKKAPPAATAAPTPKLTGRLVNSSDKCDWPENVKFVLTRDGAAIASTQMIFPGGSFPLALDKGRYAVQILDTSGALLATKAVDVGSEGWSFVTGCVK